MVKRVPLLRELAKAGHSLLSRIVYPGTKEYWEKRYAKGRTTGQGSYGKFGKFKAETINDFIEKNNIKSVIEFGCGDGNQLALFKVDKYIGLDVSKSGIKKCVERFGDDKRKSFFLYDSGCFSDNLHLFNSDLSLSLDVIYHLIEDELFERYMRHLFSASDRFVMIYSSDTDVNRMRAAHCKNRRFTDWVAGNIHGWKLIKKIKNKYPKEAFADFFIYEKKRRS
jgi:SAM-dependent methyltransferase